MIKIDIKNTDENRRRFATVVLTIDRNDFLIEAEKIRSTFQIEAETECPHKTRNKGYYERLLTQKLDNTILLRLWYAVEYNSLHEYIKDKQIYKPDPEHQKHQTLLLLNKVSKLRYKNGKNRKLCDDFAKKVTTLRKKLNLSPQMDRVISHAILCNVVKAEDLRLAYAYVDFEEGVGDDFNRMKSFIMQVSLQATLQDVVEAYNCDIKPFQVQAYGVDTTIPLATKDEVFRDRERYWLNKQGLGYKMIAAKEEGLAQYKRAQKTYKALKMVPNTPEQRRERLEAERIVTRVENLTPGIKKSVQRYKILLQNTVQNLPEK